MNANYSEICRAGNLEADFQQSPLVQFLWSFYNIVKHQLFEFNKKKKKKKTKQKKKKNRKKYFLDKKSLYSRCCI